MVLLQECTPGIEQWPGLDREQEPPQTDGCVLWHALLPLVQSKAVCVIVDLLGITFEGLSDFTIFGRVQDENISSAGWRMHDAGRPFSGIAPLLEFEVETGGLLSYHCQ